MIDPGSSLIALRRLSLLMPAGLICCGDEQSSGIYPVCQRLTQ